MEQTTADKYKNAIDQSMAIVIGAFTQVAIMQGRMQIVANDLARTMGGVCTIKINPKTGEEEFFLVPKKVTP
jgi:hypothetical protein